MILTINNAQDDRRTIEANVARQTGLPAVVKPVLIDFTYCGTESFSIETKKSDLDEWQEQLSYTLDLADYRELTPEELATPPFNFSSEDDMRDFIAKNLPYGLRKNRDVGPHIVFRVDDRYRQCIVIAEIMTFEPLDRMDSDYGGFVILLEGLGDCRIAQKHDGTLSDQLLNKLTDDLRSMAVK